MTTTHGSFLHDGSDVASAAAITYDGTGSGLSSTDVQDAIDELYINLQSTPPADVGTINFVVSGTVGVQGDLELGFDGVWTAARLFATAAGAIVVNIWKDTYANFPPTVADKITSSTPPTITATNSKSEDTTLSGWTTAFHAGDILRINVDSSTTITQATLSLSFRRPLTLVRGISDSVTINESPARVGSFHLTATDSAHSSDGAYLNLHTAGDSLTTFDTATAVIT